LDEVGTGVFLLFRTLSKGFSLFETGSLSCCTNLTVLFLLSMRELPKELQKRKKT
jgi:hypothetical protein